MRVQRRLSNRSRQCASGSGRTGTGGTATRKRGIHYAEPYEGPVAINDTCDDITTHKRQFIGWAGTNPIPSGGSGA
ncbi:hypothetical protein Raf01_92250 [Rugosimonospora africana]|uniref:Uncharacterized protein n=1 Tax=Rugosimonospora africana TaxID=556532 RepID=A0A8J3R3I4_9ACTN|nr:hypothetical protein Raf01_92250 [Rugosimonospora africana]